MRVRCELRTHSAPYGVEAQFFRERGVHDRPALRSDDGRDADAAGDGGAVGARSDTGNVKKLCACGRAKWSGCAHPWYVDYKAPKDHPRRGISEKHPDGERYRKNLDMASGRRSANIREAQDEARRAITAWLDGRIRSTSSRRTARRWRKSWRRT